MYLYRSAQHSQTSRGKELLFSSGSADVEHSLALTFTPSCWILKTPAWVCSSNFWYYQFSSESTGEQDHFLFVSRAGMTWFWKSSEKTRRETVRHDSGWVTSILNILWTNSLLYFQNVTKMSLQTILLWILLTLLSFFCIFWTEERTQPWVR